MSALCSAGPGANRSVPAGLEQAERHPLATPARALGARARESALPASATSARRAMTRSVESTIDPALDGLIGLLIVSAPPVRPWLEHPRRR
jgi:hypothetical protein